MLSQLYSYLSDYQKGIFLIIAGTVLILYTMGLAEHIFSMIILLSAIAMIAEGLSKTQYHTKLLALINNYRNKP